MLLNGRGLDITALFEGYHPFTERHRARLASFKPVSRTVQFMQTVHRDNVQKVLNDGSSRSIVSRGEVSRVCHLRTCGIVYVAGRCRYPIMCSAPSASTALRGTVSR